MTEQLEHDHEHGNQGLLRRISHALAPHSHDHQTAALDAALATDRGIWAVQVSLDGVTAIIARPGTHMV